MLHPHSTHPRPSAVHLAVSLVLLGSLAGHLRTAGAHPLLPGSGTGSEPVAASSPATPDSGRSALTLDGGWVQLRVKPAERRLEGLVILMGVRVSDGVLHAELPPGVEVKKTYLQCREVAGTVAATHLTIPVANCPVQGCAVEITWSLDAADWDGLSLSSRIAVDGYRLRASDVMPRLAVDANALAADVEPDRSLPDTTAVAPSGNWNWVIQVDGSEAGSFSRQGAVAGVLEFSDAWSSPVVRFQPEGPAVSQRDGLVPVEVSEPDRRLSATRP